jgi:glycosyltransferase involved in cell wall biosynthesis
VRPAELKHQAHRTPVVSFLSEVTPVILTWNEAPNIGRLLGSLSWATEVVVLDSGSNDETRAICATFPNVRFLTRKFDEHAAQWNHAIHETEISTPWVWAMDADYLPTRELLEELRGLSPSADTAGFRTVFTYCIGGRPLRGTLYPPVVTLYRRDLASYVQEGHTQRVRVQGEVATLRGQVLHDDRKPLNRWLQSQDRYASLEASLLRRTSWANLRWQDRIRRLVVVAPWFVPLYCLVVKGGLLDGRAGLIYALQRAIAESVLALKLIDSESS